MRIFFTKTMQIPCKDDLKIRYTSLGSSVRRLGYVLGFGINFGFKYYELKEKKGKNGREAIWKSEAYIINKL